MNILILTAFISNIWGQWIWILFLHFALLRTIDIVKLHPLWSYGFELVFLSKFFCMYNHNIPLKLSLMPWEWSQFSNPLVYRCLSIVIFWLFHTFFGYASNCPFGPIYIFVYFLTQRKRKIEGKSLISTLNH